MCTTTAEPPARRFERDERQALVPLAARALFLQVRELTRGEVTLVRASEAILSQGRKVSCKRLINQSGIAAFKHSWRRAAVDRVLARYSSASAGGDANLKINARDSDVAHPHGK